MDLGSGRVYFGNELNLASFGVYDRMLSSDRVGGVFLPTLDVEMEFQAKGLSRFVKLRLGDRVLVCSSARPIKMGLEEYKSFARRLSALNSGEKPIYLSMYFAKPSTTLLLLEKLAPEMEREIAGVEVNFIPLYTTRSAGERDRSILKAAEAARELKLDLELVAKIPYYAAFCGDELSELLKSFDSVVVSLHPLVEVGGSPYFLHSPLSSKLAIECLKIAIGEILEEYQSSIALSGDFFEPGEYEALAERFSAVHLDLNLVLGDCAPKFFSEPLPEVEGIAVPPSPPEGFQIRVLREVCDRCGEYYPCRYACPENAIEVEWDGYPSVSADRCTFCGLCLAVCPRGALELVRVIRPS